MRKLLFESDYNYTLEDYIENLKDNETYEEGKEYSENEDFYDWKYRMQEWDCEDFWANLKYPNHKGAFIITGVLGLWHGNPDIQPVLCKDLKSAIERCVCNRDIMQFEVYYEDGHYEVLAHHHDGTNCFDLHQLSENGERIAYEKAGYGIHTFVKNWEKRIPAKNPWLY